MALKEVMFSEYLAIHHSTNAPHSSITALEVCDRPDQPASYHVTPSIKMGTTVTASL